MNYGGLRVLNPRGISEVESPDCRNEIIAGNRLKTRPGMVKTNITALPSPIYFLLNPKSGFCKEDYKLVIDRNGRIMVGPENYPFMPQSANIVGYWKMEEASGIIYDETVNDNDGFFTGVYTKLLLPLIGSDGDVSATDLSQKQHTITFGGTAQIDTDIADPFGGNDGVLLVDGNSDYIQLANSEDFVFSTNSFTIESYIRFASLQLGNIFAYSTASGANQFLYDNVGDDIYVYAQGSERIRTSGISFSTNTWYHVAFVRNGNNWQIYIDGVSYASVTDSVSLAIPNHAKGIMIGAKTTAPWQFFNGWFANYRVSNTARWTSNFTPPTSYYTETGVGDGYQETGKVGYALEFDDDYIDCDLSPSLNPATAISISAWIYIKGGAGTHREVIARWATVNEHRRNYEFSIRDTNKFEFKITNNNLDSGAITVTDPDSPSLNTWYHYIGTWDGVTMRLYRNGVQVDMAYQTGMATAALLKTSIGAVIGKGFPDTILNKFNGLLDEVTVWDVALRPAECSDYLNWSYEL